jgi:hypothetical protein
MSQTPQERSLLLTQAEDSLKNDLWETHKAAADFFGVGLSSLSHRARGGQDRQTAHQFQQKLTPSEETELADWIVELSEANCSPSYAEVQEMAWFLNKHRANAERVGVDWIRRFKSRNPQVKTMMGGKVEAARINGVTTDLINTYFAKYQAITARYSITQANTWNMDEHGMALGICSNGKVLTAAYKKRAHVRAPQNGEWVSVIECASATGEDVRPTVIFKGNTPQTTWFTLQGGPKWLYTCSPKAWVTTDIALTWLTTVFIPDTDRGDGKWRLLLLDGQTTHKTPQFLRTAYKNKVRLFFLPAHSSHVLQPLDLCFFSPLKRQYRAAIAKLAIWDDGAPVKKQRFVHQYQLAREDILQRRVVLKGWKAAGLWPWNPELVLKSDFLPLAPSEASEAQRPKTPPETPSQPVVYTPQKSTDVTRQFRIIKSPIRRRGATAQLLKKAAKTIDILTVKLAHSEWDLAKTRHQISAKRTRQPIPHDPKAKFLELVDIIEAIEREQSGRTTGAESSTPRLQPRPQAAMSTATPATRSEYDVCLGNWTV